MADRYDIAIIGGGIVGLATALAVTDRFPRVRLIILDKEPKVAAHQTGHNSGVIHSGIYYKPGSYKAQQCVEGKALMRTFCEEHAIKVIDCGKVIVATAPEELPRLQTLYERGQANGVPVEMIGPERLREIEPHAAGIRAIWSPTTSIVDYIEVAEAMARDLRQRGVEIELGAGVTKIARTSEGLDLWATRRAVLTKRLINCAGLYSDVVARMAGARTDVEIVPFRGEYYMVRPDRRSLVRTLIYPVPDPEFPFLGVHFTNTVHGEVEAGPNAVLAFAREGYTFWKIRPSELSHTLTYSGMWNMARKYWKTGGYEVYRSLSKKAFVKALQRLVPEIQPEDVERGGAGIRAQAVAPDGSLVDDFRIVGDDTGIHVLNAPSPGATASLAIGRHIAGLATERFGLT